MYEIEKRMLETAYNMHKMFLTNNKLVYKQLLYHLECELKDYEKKFGQKHHLESRVIDFYAKLWNFK